MALVANFVQKEDLSDVVTFQYITGYTSPLPTSGTFTIGTGGGMAYLGKKYSTLTVTQMHEYGDASANSFELVYSDGTRASFTSLGVPQLSNTPVNLDVSDCIAIIADGSLPASGNTSFFTYSLS